MSESINKQETYALLANKLEKIETYFQDTLRSSIEILKELKSNEVEESNVKQCFEKYLTSQIEAVQNIYNMEQVTQVDSLTLTESNITMLTKNEENQIINSNLQESQLKVDNVNQIQQQDVDQGNKELKLSQTGGEATDKSNRVSKHPSLEHEIQQLESLTDATSMQDLKLAALKLKLKVLNLRDAQVFNIEVQKKVLKFVETLNHQLYEETDPSCYYAKLDIASILQQITELIV